MTKAVSLWAREVVGYRELMACSQALDRTVYRPNRRTTSEASRNGEAMEGSSDSALNAATVCLSFDFDAMSAWMTEPGSVTPWGLSRGEYGARVGVPRVLELLDRERLPATFFVPGHTAETYPQLVAEIVDSGHEVGHHGYLHEPPLAFGGDREAERAVLRRGAEVLERIAGSAPRGYRAPAWAVSPLTIALLEEEDFLYDSSLAAEDYRCHFARSGDVAHRDRAFEFGPETGVVEVPTGIHWEDWAQFEFDSSPDYICNTMASPSKVFEIWAAEIDFLAERVPGGVMTLCLHPQVIGRGSRILLLERLIAHCRQYPGLRFARLREVAEEFRAAAHHQGVRHDG
jgi:peptidoglycan/xylan/chitin deacetylase (PgdA/CDA1 family)